MSVRTTPALLEAADIIIDRMKNPSRLLRFISDALDWIYQYEAKRQDLPGNERYYFNLKTFCDEIVLRWMEAGNNPKAAISEGLHKVYGQAGHEGFKEMAIRIIQSLSEEWQDGSPSEEYFVESTTGLNLLFEIYTRFADHDKTVSKDRVAA